MVGWGADGLASPLGRQALRRAVAEASRLGRPGIGHSLLMPTRVVQLLDWLEQQ